MSNRIAPQQKFEQDLEEARQRNIARNSKSLAAQRKEIEERNNRPEKSSHGYNMRAKLRRVMLMAGVHSTVCAICGSRITLKQTHIDHCHESNQWRGFLCRGCNLGLGQFKDSAERLDKAASYLRGQQLGQVW